MSLVIHRNHWYIWNFCQVSRNIMIQRVSNRFIFNVGKPLNYQKCLVLDSMNHRSNISLNILHVHTLLKPIVNSVFTVAGSVWLYLTRASTLPSYQLDVVNSGVTVTMIYHLVALAWLPGQSSWTQRSRQRRHRGYPAASHSSCVTARPV